MNVFLSLSLFLSLYGDTSTITFINFKP
jgi:hypothetical protein